MAVGGVLGKKYVAALVTTGDLKHLLKAGDISPLFKSNETELFDFVMGHAKKYQALPDPETIEKHTGVELPKAEEPPGYYLDLLKERHTELSLKKAMQEAGEFLKPGNKKPQEALETVQAAVMGLSLQKQSHLVSDFREAMGPILAAYKEQWSVDDQGVYMGWPTVDEMTGGLLPGDVASMIGRPAAGKTFQMLYGCHHAWHEQEKPGMFVSMEMNPLAIQQRLAAMNAHVPMSKLKNAALSTTAMGKLKGALTAVSKKDVPLWVVDGNLTATVEDIWMLAEQLKPEVIYIDGAYLLKHPTEKDRFKRVAENADLIKTRLAGDRPVVCSWQFAKTASQKAKKKNETVGLEDIGYSDAIAQVSSLVMGLFEEESVETLQSRRIEILKGRNGEVGSFSTRWDFTGMDFTELADVNLADLQIT